MFTQHKHTVTCSNNTIVARLLAQQQGGSSNSSQHCWEQCFVHGTTGVVCAAAAPLTLTHITTNTTAVYQDAASYYRTVKHRGQTTTASRNIQSGHSKHDLVFSIPMDNSMDLFSGRGSVESINHAAGQLAAGQGHGQRTKNISHET